MHIVEAIVAGICIRVNYGRMDVVDGVMQVMISAVSHRRC